MDTTTILALDPLGIAGLLEVIDFVFFAITLLYWTFDAGKKKFEKYRTVNHI